MIIQVGIKQKRTSIDNGPRERQYSSFYLSLGFTKVIIAGLQKLMYLLCSKLVASDNETSQIKSAP